MRQRLLQVLAVIGGLGVLVLLVLGADVATEAVRQVFVVNFPDVVEDSRPDLPRPAGRVERGAQGAPGAS